MIRIILLLIPQFALAADPLTFPVFLRSGFSTILEFEEVPTKVVLGDTQSFQIEKLDKSLVIKTLAPYATSNMFVYFKVKAPRLFVLTASEDAEPTYYKKFESVIPPKPKTIAQVKKHNRGILLKSATFSPKKDFLTIEVSISADGSQKIRPSWEKVRLLNGKNSIAPSKLWSERQEVQKDSSIVARFIFNKPNIPIGLKNIKLVVPLEGVTTPFTMSLAGGLDEKSK